MRRRKPPLYARWANPTGSRWVAAEMRPGPWRRGVYVGGLGEPAYRFVLMTDCPAELMPAAEAAG